MNTFLEIISGEFILRYMPNGGKAILIRTVLVSLVLYLVAISLKSYTSENSIFRFSLDQFQKEVTETITWLGAILGGSYAALYTRFSSQWSYLADLYNQQMSAALNLNSDAIESDTYKYWQAAFVEDAVCMHLDTKAGFSNLVLELLRDEKIKSILEEQKHFGNIKYNKVLSRLEKVTSAN
jgi:hypothetical protein